MFVCLWTDAECLQIFGGMVWWGLEASLSCEFGESVEASEFIDNVWMTLIYLTKVDGIVEGVT